MPVCGGVAQVSALRSIPPWRSLTLEMQAPSDTQAYGDILRAIPRSYTKVHLRSACGEEEAFLLGAPTDRTEAEPLTVSVDWYMSDKYRVLRESMGRTHPHVTVRFKSWNDSDDE